MRNYGGSSFVEVLSTLFCFSSPLRKTFSYFFNFEVINCIQCKKTLKNSEKGLYKTNFGGLLYYFYINLSI
jgi:hypothetical protein